MWSITSSTSTGETEPFRQALGVLVALGAIALGALLILAEFELPVIVTLAGAGLVVVGLATAAGVDGAGHSGWWVRPLTGLVTIKGAGQRQ